MKKALVTIAIGDSYKKLCELTHPTLKRYAEKIGAEFVVIDAVKLSQSFPQWEKFQIYDLFSKYDRIAYIDSDIIIRDDCPDIFDIVPNGQFGAFNEAPFTDRVALMQQICVEYKEIITQWDGSYYNTGVLVIPKCNRSLFVKPKEEKNLLYEQTYLNMKIAQMRERGELKTFELPHKFNRMTCLDNATGESRLGSYIVHYAGVGDLPLIYGIIKDDLEEWKSKNGNYDYKKNVLISVTGGVGDQIDAEPVLRYYLKKLPSHEVTIESHFPRIFEHLGVKTNFHNSTFSEKKEPVVRLFTMAEGNSSLWMSTSTALTHVIDFISIALLRMTISDEDKQIKLVVKDEDKEDLESTKSSIGCKDTKNMILVHPGHGWPSKTFPVSWWQEVIDGIAKEVPVGLIGKNFTDEERVLQVNAGDNVYDFRDLLQIGTLFAIIEDAKVLVSNDSSPVHMAGAFDNQILLVPTCKYPEHVLPYRNGSKSYKTKALYKDMMCDYFNHDFLELKQCTIDKVPEGKDILDFIPDASQVIEEAIKMFKEEK